MGIYNIRLNSDGTFDLEAPDGTVVQTGYSLPADFGEASDWVVDMYAHAFSNGNVGEALQTIQAPDGNIRIDDR